MKSDELLFDEAKKLHINGEIKNAQVIYLQLLKKIKINQLEYVDYKKLIGIKKMHFY